MTKPATPRSPRLRRVLGLLPILGLALAVSGCETLDKMNPFTEKEKPLPGARAPVFPEGVPGVDYNAPPPQPANSAKYELPPETPAPATPAQ
ncbi:hypothetical protein [Ancylobacter radicis]|uniref:Lipoprotein n=1 Tax=Ancylobacter radicis TaxID=2836179 RepID=A0ABS5R8G7_9HYPH|nr:hypothetical protein [Ancylobacter radicis]MBS9477969.1 hypothetical protein [Ancylobacter radicis]